jgi:hypothetical protein
MGKAPKDGGRPQSSPKMTRNPGKDFTIRNPTIYNYYSEMMMHYMFFSTFWILFGCYKSKILRGWRLHLTWATLGNSGRFSDFPIQFLKPSGFGGLPAFSKGVSQWCHCHGEASGILELADSFQVKLWRPIVRLKVPAAPSFSIQSIEEMRSLNVDIYYILESSYTYQ